MMRFSRKPQALILGIALTGGVAGYAVARTSASTSAGHVHASLKLADPNEGPSKMGFAPIVKEVLPSVVNISSSKVVRTPNQFPQGLPDDPMFRQFFGRQFGRGPEVPKQRREQSLGSGVIVSPEGYILTNNHVVDGATDVKVTLSDRRELKAKIIGTDPKTDVAVLKIEGANFPAITLGDSAKVQVGDYALAIGDPFGVGQTVTHGIVSAVARTQVGISDYQFFIQTDAAINPGNSGGALVDMNGRLVGINSAIYSRSGGSQGIGFAIPANGVRVVVASAQGGSSAVRRAWLGAKLQEVTPEIADSLGLKRPSGALIANLVAGSPAARAGLKTGDLIVSIDGIDVEDPNGFDYRFATKPLGGAAQVGVVRQGKSFVVPVSLEPLPDTPHDEIEIKNRSPFAGVTVSNLSPALADELQLDPQTEGVAITSVADGSTAQGIGFRKGDIVVSVNGQKIAKSGDLQKATDSGGHAWRVTIVRGGQQISVMFSG